MIFGMKMTARGYWIRLAICIVIDLLDFTLGRALFLVPVEEVPIAALMVLIFGLPGIAYLAEIAELTEQVDAFIPTATLIALWVGWRRGFFTPGPKTAEPPPPLTPPGPRPRNSRSNS